MSPPIPRSIVNLSEVLAALSHALDLTEGQPPGHSIRSCIIGMRIAEAVGVPESERAALYYALLLKDAGCSSNAARFAALFGSRDQDAKHWMKLVDWHHTLRLAFQTARTVGIGQSLPTRVRHFLGIARTENVTRDLIAVRCERGADIALELGFPEATADAIRSLDEHWSGEGFPRGLRGDAIPLLARIANLAQTIDILHRARGLGGALDVIRDRRGSWFDPRLVDVVVKWKRDAAWWETLDDHAAPDAVVAVEPVTYVRRVDDSGLDRVASAFAEIIDAKSPYTFRHSSNVARIACQLARAMGLDDVTEHRLQRAGLLHDIGKLGVSSRILEKPGKLDAVERAEIERHPAYSWEILSRVGAFASFARLAAVHHEKLDGSGYPWKLTAADLDTPMRILVVADMYEALTADRPYRAGLTHEAALAILERDAPVKVCAAVVSALAGLPERGHAPIGWGEAKPTRGSISTGSQATRSWS